MAVVTPWGYTLEADEIPPLLDAETFAAMTGGAFDASDGRVAPILAGVSAAVRNFCCWHVAPSLACTCETEGPGCAIMLPSKALSDVARVEVLGEELGADGYEWRADGMLRRTGGLWWPVAWRSVAVAYTAGYDLAATPDLAAIVCQVASNALAAAPGVRSEQAGGVSIEYNATGSGVTGGIALLGRDMAMLAPYRLPAVPR